MKSIISMGGIMSKIFFLAIFLCVSFTAIASEFNNDNTGFNVWYNIIIPAVIAGVISFCINIVSHHVLKKSMRKESTIEEKGRLGLKLMIELKKQVEELFKFVADTMDDMFEALKYGKWHIYEKIESDSKEVFKKALRFLDTNYPDSDNEIAKKTRAVIDHYYKKFKPKFDERMKKSKEYEVFYKDYGNELIKDKNVMKDNLSEILAMIDNELKP